MSSSVRYPNMRVEVVDALASLADPVLQANVWGRYEAGSDFYEDLTININILYDCHVFPSPMEAVGVVIHDEEVESLAQLWRVFDPLIKRLGNAPDSAYLSDPDWPRVIAAASAAKKTMEDSDRSDV